MKNLAAAFVFFTRLPFWRIKAFNVSAEYYKQVVNYWAITGWLTASVMAGVLYLTAQILPLPVAIIVAMLSRLLITGALHEDGLADFFDGFGGGSTRERTLEIMKDSHIGTYGVICLIFYFLLFYQLISVMDLHLACMVILVADPFGKFVASNITKFLAYARTAETSKSKVVYDKMTITAFAISFIAGVLPLVLLLDIQYWLAALLPLLVFILLVYLMRKKIQGYTGDCCGALFLMCELSFYLGIIIIYV